MMDYESLQLRNGTKMEQNSIKFLQAGKSKKIIAYKLIKNAVDNF